LSDPLYILIAAALLLILVAPVEPAQRAAFFIIAAPAVPMGVAAPLPFPGIQQLLIASHYMLAVVVLLFPLFFLLPERRGNSPSAVSDYCPWIFLCYVSIIFILSMDATAAMRAAVQVALTFSFPYLFLRRAMSNQKDVEIFVQAIVVVAMILFCITSVAAAKQWDFYRVNVPSSVFSIPEARFGFLRIQITMGGNGLALHLIMGLIMLEVLRLSEKVSFMLLLAMRVAIPVAIYMCDSRAALIVLVLAYVIFFILMLKNKVAQVVLAGGVAVAVLIGAVALLIGDFSSIENDSFSYRQQLFQTSYEYILMHPVWGDFFYLESGYFNHLIQGQGIVDIVSVYLQVALQYGMFGAALFFPIFLSTILPLGRRVMAIRGQRVGAKVMTRNFRNKMFDANWSMRAASENSTGSSRQISVRRAAAPLAAYVALLIGWLALCATTSDVGLVLHVGIVIAAISRGMLAAPVTLDSTADS
jgi:hypothetical protein